MTLRMALCLLWLGLAQAQGAEPPAPPTDVRAKAGALIADLSADAFDVRELAQQNLLDLGAEVVPFLEESLKKAADADLAQRIRTIIGRLTVKQRFAKALKDLESKDWATVKTALTAVLLPRSAREPALEQELLDHSRGEGQQAEILRWMLEHTALRAQLDMMIVREIEQADALKAYSAKAEADFLERCLNQLLAKRQNAKSAEPKK